MGCHGCLAELGVFDKQIWQEERGCVTSNCEGHIPQAGHVAKPGEACGSKTTHKLPPTCLESTKALAEGSCIRMVHCWHCGPLVPPPPCLQEGSQGLQGKETLESLWLGRVGQASFTPVQVGGQPGWATQTSEMAKWLRSATGDPLVGFCAPATCWALGACQNSSGPGFMKLP